MFLQNRDARVLLSLFILVFVLGCLGLNTKIATSTPSQALPTPLISTSTSTVWTAPFPTETFPPSLTPTPPPVVRRVLIVSIDGLRPDIIPLAPMPNLMALVQNGAYSLTAQTVRPSVTLVSHSSMLVGVCPAKHGVDWNDYIPERGYAIGTDLFDIASAVGLETYMFVTKNKLQQITEPGSLDRFVFVSDRDTVLAERLAAEFPPNFGVLFVHLGLVDGMGHAYGWLSQEQLSVAFRADEALGRILADLDARGLRNETLIIISADHGGHGTSHGSSAPEDMTIPWIAAGPGIQPRALTSPVHTMDTAATAAFALGLPIPLEWDGVPVYEAFGLPVERQSLQCP